MDIQLVAGDIPGLRHEGMHAICHKPGQAMPSWLSEGLAQYFESFVAGRSMGEIDSGTAAKALFALRGGTSCVNVIGADGDAFRLEGNDVPYAVSVAIVAAMIEGPDRERFVEFVKRRGWADGSPYQAFAQTFGSDYNPDLIVRTYLEGKIGHGN